MLTGGHTVITKVAALGRHLSIRRLAGEKRGRSLLDDLDSPCAKSMTEVYCSHYSRICRMVVFRELLRRTHIMVAEPHSPILSVRKDARPRVGRDRKDPHYARLIRWLAVRPRCMSSVVQVLVAGAHTYLAELASSRHIPLNLPLSSAFDPMTSYGVANSPIEAWPLDHYACMTWCHRMIALRSKQSQ